MTEQAVPFTIDIESCDGRRMQVTCLDITRALAGTRTVYRAVWESRPVIVKLFARFGKARYHMKREWRGLQHLQERRLSTPKPLFCGRTSNGWVVVTERIEGALTASELWDRADTLEQKVNLLCRIAIPLARQHIAGVIQSDLHLGNFLIRGEEIFILDPAMMRFRGKQVGRSRSIEQLGLLISMLSEQAAGAIETVFNEYAAARLWSIRREDVERLRKVYKRYRKKGTERVLRKFLRTNRWHQTIRHGRWRGLADRAFLEATGVDALTAGLDTTAQQGRILKNGHTCFVSQAKLDGMDVVIKRYNHKGLLHSLRHTLRGSRAKRSWSNANRLRLLEIATPRPLAYVDEYRGPILWRSYFIAEFTRGPRLHSILADDAVPEEQKRQMIEQARRLIDRLAQYGISHGDLKHSNILMTAAGPVLTDLDGMRVYRLPWVRRRRRARDLARFARDCHRLEEPRKEPNP